MSKRALNATVWHHRNPVKNSKNSLGKTREQNAGLEPIGAIVRVGCDPASRRAREGLKIAIQAQHHFRQIEWA